MSLENELSNSINSWNTIFYIVWHVNGVTLGASLNDQEEKMKSSYLLTPPTLSIRRHSGISNILLTC